MDGFLLTNFSRKEKEECQFRIFLEETNYSYEPHAEAMIENGTWNEEIFGNF